MFNYLNLNILALNRQLNHLIIFISPFLLTNQISFSSKLSIYVFFKYTNLFFKNKINITWNRVYFPAINITTNFSNLKDKLYYLEYLQGLKNFLSKKLQKEKNLKYKFFQEKYKVYLVLKFFIYLFSKSNIKDKKTKIYQFIVYSS